MLQSLGYHLYACGKKPLPPQITFADNTYHLREVFKHDFFAATALYESNHKTPAAKMPKPPKIVLKLSRQQNLLGLPLSWLGQMLCWHEIYILKHLSKIPGIPKLLGKYGKTGFICQYIDGYPLDKQKNLPDNFFDKLHQLLKQIHQRNIVYLDMNKRSNILLGSDNQPHLVDFQISVHIGDYLLILKPLSRYLRDTLQRADIYHLFKHKRKLAPNSLTPQEHVLSHRISRLIKLHRLAANPIRKHRRNLLKFLYSKGLMLNEKNAPLSSNSL